MIGAKTSIEPLEPDAGNAAEGSEAWPCDLPCMAFLLIAKERRKAGIENLAG
jgi:hypothetical protein